MSDTQNPQDPEQYGYAPTEAASWDTPQPPYDQGDPQTYGQDGPTPPQPPAPGNGYAQYGPYAQDGTMPTGSGFDQGGSMPTGPGYGQGGTVPPAHQGGYGQGAAGHGGSQPGFGPDGRMRPGTQAGAQPGAQPGYEHGGYGQHPQPEHDRYTQQGPDGRHPQYGHPGGYEQAAYQAGSAGSYPAGGYGHAAPPQPGADAYGQGAHPGAQNSPSGYAGYGTYVPEPLAAQLPSETEPGAEYGVPTAGGAWTGAGYGGPQAAEGWAGPPAAAAQAAHTHAPYPATGRDHPAQEANAGAAAEPELERTAALPVVEEPPQAPHRTGSPIIPPGIQPAALTAVLGLLLAGGAALGKPALAVVLVLLEGVTAAGWFRLNGMWPARQGIVLAFLAGVTADAAVLAVNGAHGPVALLGTLGVWLLFVLVLQLRHHGSADERLSSLTATSASTLLTVVAAGYLATATSHAGSDPVVVALIAVAAATLVRAPRLPGGEPVSLVASLAVATVTGALTGPATGFGTGHALALALAAGASALIGLRVASYDWPSRFVHFTAGVALPLTAAAPATYALAQAFT
jgi:hypothetical protein